MNLEVRTKRYVLRRLRKLQFSDNRNFFFGCHGIELGRNYPKSLMFCLGLLLSFGCLFSALASLIQNLAKMANRSAAIGFSGFRPRYDGNIYNRPEVRAAREGKAVEDLIDFEPANE